MKRLLLYAFSLLLGIVCYAQPTSFFGLKFGEKYSMEEIVSSVGSNGSYFKNETFNFTEGITFDSYYFTDVKYGKSSFPIMALQFLPTSGKLVAVSFCFLADEEYDAESMEQTYKAIADSLQRTYTMLPIPMEDPSLIRLNSMDTFSLTSVRLDKIIESGNILSIELTYLSLLDFALEALDALKVVPNRPDIQDTFMGLKLGEKYFLTQVKNALSGRGTYLRDERNASGPTYIFMNVSFAGRQWNFAALYFTRDYKLYSVDFYDSLNNTSRENRSAKADFSSLKSKLDDKYGFTETKEDDDDNLTAVYLGGNDIAALLGLSEERSKGGVYRIFLKLTYVQTQLFDKVRQLSNDEL